MVGRHCRTFYVNPAGHPGLAARFFGEGEDRGAWFSFEERQWLADQLAARGEVPAYGDLVTCLSYDERDDHSPDCAFVICDETGALINLDTLDGDHEIIPSKFLSLCDGRGLDYWFGHDGIGFVRVVWLDMERFLDECLANLRTVIHDDEEHYLTTFTYEGQEYLLSCSPEAGIEGEEEYRRLLKAGHCVFEVNEWECPLNLDEQYPERTIQVTGVNYPEC